MNRRLIVLSLVDKLSLELLRQTAAQRVENVIVITRAHADTLPRAPHDEPMLKLLYDGGDRSCRACGAWVGAQHRCPVLKRAERERQKTHSAKFSARRR